MRRKRQQKPTSVAMPALYGASQMDYQDYLRVPDLLRLQQPQSKPPHHDEMLFIIIHQAYELWFKLLIHEAEMVLRHLGNATVEGAHHHAKRMVAVLELLIKQIHLLETMKPVDFLAFRDHLKPASGFQSLQFRELEFLVGYKDEGYLRFFENRPQLRQQLQRRLEEPDLGQAFVAVLGRLGLDVPKDADNKTLRGDPRTTDQVARALVPLYQDPESNMTLYLLCERLLEMDEAFSLWRTHHVHVVERIIGSKPGTGGSSGVPYLRTTTGKRAFPYLWEVRTLLELPARKEVSGKGEGKRARRG